MKPILVSFLFLFAISSATAQENSSSEAEAFFNRAMSEINVRHVTVINAFGTKVQLRNLPDSAAQKMASEYVRLTKMKSEDIEVMTFFILMESAKSAQEDLKAIMAKVKSINEQKQQLQDIQSKMQRQQSITSVQLDSFNLLRSKTIALQNHQNPDTVKFIRSGIVRKQLSKTDIGSMIEQTKNDLNSMNEMGELDQTRMQLYMDRRDKASTTASNFFKKFSDTAEDIIKNLK